MNHAELTKLSAMPISVGIAEDHVLMRGGLERILAAFGYEVCAKAGDGEAFIRQLEQLAQPADVCLVDINMPGMDGFGVTEEIRLRWEETKVLALTGFENEAMVIRMIALGAHGYLLKSTTEDRLDEAIRTVLERGVYFNEHMSSRLYHAVLSREIRTMHLSDLERNVLKQCCSDLSWEAIGQKLGTSRRSAESARDRLFEKFGVRSRVSLALLAVRYGYVPLEYMDTRK